MKIRNRDALGYAILVMAVCSLAAIGFDYIMETLTARVSDPQRASGHPVAPAVQADR